MKALVLSGGLGERLRPLTLETPKPLLEVGGRPLIHYPLLMLKRAGITQVAINVHHLPGHFERVLGNGGQLGMEITYAPEPVLLGSGGPLLTLRDYFDGDRFAVLNADSILDLELGKMIGFHRERGGLATIALYRPLRDNYYSALEIDGEARIRRMRLKVAGGGFDDYPTALSIEAAAGLRSLMFCGVYICEPVILERMPKSAPFSSMRDIFAPMVAEGLALFGWVHDGLFRTVDDLDSYAALKEEFAEKAPRLGYL